MRLWYRLFLLERKHTRAAGIIYGLAWDTPSQTIQESVKWKPLKLFYHFKLLSLVFNSYYDLSHLSLRKLSDKRERTYNFRKTNCLRLPKPRLDLMKKSISYQGALLWNSLSNSLIILKNSFKRQQLND